jgi:hypothetical protein
MWKDKVVLNFKSMKEIRLALALAALTVISADGSKELNVDQTQPPQERRASSP